MKATDFYLIRTISNLHVGSGEGDFSVVDKQVQRDSITGAPTIHASGIKGAIREAMTYEAEQSADNKAQLYANVLEVFGSEPKAQKEHRQGKFNFFDAQLLALPVRSSHDFYYLATCPAMLQECIGLLKQFALKHPMTEALMELLDQKNDTSQYFGKDHSGDLRLEDLSNLHYNPFKPEALKPYLGGRLALLTNDDFDQVAGELPIIARNYLNDGISRNLWYEEYVPREARFLTMVTREGGVDHLNDFLSRANQVVQLGANATVGYGLCAFKKI